MPATATLQTVQPLTATSQEFQITSILKFLQNQELSFVTAILNTEAKRCFATHDEDNDYFNMRIYIILTACVYIQQFNFIQ